MPEGRPRPPSRDEANSMTTLAAVGLAALGLAMLAFLGTITFGIMFFGIVGVIAGLGGLATLHYLTWGWYLAQIRERHLAEEQARPFWVPERDAPRD